MMMDGSRMWAPEHAGALWAAMFAVMALIGVFYIFLQWRIFSKAGFPGALALVNLCILVPVIGPLIVLGLQTWFAFAKWPALRSAGES